MSGRYTTERDIVDRVAKSPLVAATGAVEGQASLHSRIWMPRLLQATFLNNRVPFSSVERLPSAAVVLRLEK
jgi:hypothetical protein